MNYELEAAKLVEANAAPMIRDAQIANRAGIAGIVMFILLFVSLFIVKTGAGDGTVILLSLGAVWASIVYVAYTIYLYNK